MKCASPGCELETKSDKSKYCKAHAREARERWLEMVKSKGSEKSDRESKFSQLWEKAVAAGKEAGAKAMPFPMVVQQHASPFDDNSRVVKEWVVPEGPCGFAWVTVRPGNCPFANWLKKNGRGDRAYGGGVMVWVSDYGQSITRKEAYARAMADVFREEGIHAYSESRLD